MASKDWLSARNALWLLVFLGTGCGFMARLNINIAIVSMVKLHDTQDTRTEVSSSECFDSRVHINSTYDIEKRKTNITPAEERFDWDEHIQGMILGAYYWTYWAGQIPGGFLSQKYGTKITFGLSNLGVCLCGFFIPLTARFDYRLLVALRTIQGFLGGLAWPSLNTMISLWIPPNERSRFLTSLLGGSAGGALINPVCGVLIDWFGWPVVFYSTSALGIIYIISWWYWIYESPDEHPNISREELLHIKTSLGDTVLKKKPPIPWKKILLSLPMWTAIISQWGNLWGLFTWITQSPTYFHFIHGLDIQTIGMYSGIPHIGRLITAYLVSAVCDYLLVHKKTSRTNARKIAISITCLVQACLALCLAFSGCNLIAAIIIITLLTSCNGVEAAGALGNLVDLSPNYASIIVGICQAVSVIPGMISPIVVSYFTYQNQSIEQWKKVFFVTAAMVGIPGFFSLCFGSSEIQEWNSPKCTQNEELRMLENLPCEEEESDSKTQQSTK